MVNKKESYVNISNRNDCILGCILFIPTLAIALVSIYYSYDSYIMNSYIHTISFLIISAFAFTRTYILANDIRNYIVSN